MTLKNKLKQNVLTIGSWITLAHPAIAEIMARAGIDRDQIQKAWL